MTRESESPFDVLRRLFHEPSRLAIMSALCAADDELSFKELKETCRLTDGNLNRHLKTLQDAGMIRVRKAFVRDKPRTSVSISPDGLTRFTEYLGALETVLRRAQDALGAGKKADAAPPFAKPVRA